MTTGSTIMNCSDVEKALKNFVGDLLPDNDYQAFVEHLDRCPKCTSHVRALGSFSNQLWELGDIEVPSDLDSTILFNLKKAKQAKKDAPPPKASNSKKLAIGVILIITGIGIFFGWKKFVSSPDSSDQAVEIQEVDSAVIIKAAVIKKKKKTVDDPEAERLFKQLQKMADSLEPMTKTATDKNSSEQKDLKEKEGLKEVEQVPPAEAKETDMAFMPESQSLHWHIPYFSGDNTKQLLNTIEVLDISLEYESPDFMIFSATSEKLNQLSKGIKFSHQVLLDLPQFVLQNTYPDMKIPTSIYFAKDGTESSGTSNIPSYKGKNSLLSIEDSVSSGSITTYDWHILTISSQQESLMNAVRRGGTTILYSSNEIAIFSMPALGVKELTSQIQSLGGVFPSFGGVDFSTDSPTRGTVNIMIYFQKQ